MAKNYNDIIASVYTTGNKMDFGNAMIRGNGVPLDITEVYNSYEAAVLYAATNPVAYEGQLIAVTENGDTTVYVITPAEQGKFQPTTGEEVTVYIKAVGTAPTGDGKTIEVVDGVIKVAGLNGLDATKTYQPVLVNGQLTWQEPSATTVEGLDTRITAVEAEMTTVKADIVAVDEKADTNANAIAANVTAIEKLNGGADVEGSVDAKVAAALQAAKDYADEHDEDTKYDDSALTALISELDREVAKVAEDAETANTALETSMKEYVAEQIGAQAHFKTKIVTSTDEMTDATTLYLVKATEGADDNYEEYIVIDGVATKIGSTTTDLKDYAKTADVDAALAEVIAAYVAGDEELQQKINATDGDVEAVEGALDQFKTDVAATYETKETVATLRTEVEANATEIALKANKSDVEAEFASVSETAIQQGQTIAGIQETLAEANDKIAALEAVEAEKNVIATVSEEFEVIDRKLSVKTINANKVDGLDAAIAALNEALGKKVDKLTDEEGREWTLLSPTNQDKLAALVVGDSGEIEVSGNVNVENVIGLSDYVTAKRDTVAGFYPNADAAKLAGITAGANVNVIEEIKVAGIALDPVSRSVNIPKATNEIHGVVTGTTARNGVSVDAEGTMSVNEISITKLVQAEEDILILDGGGAA